MPDNSQVSIVYVPIEKLKPAEYNPRKNTQKQVEHLKQSLEKFGVVDPILVNSAPNRKNIVIGGHFRIKVLKELQYKTVPVVYVSIPNIAEEKELNLRLNQNQGMWDIEMLKLFDIELLTDIGFEDIDLLFFDELEIIDDTALRLDTSFSEPEIITQKGDVIELGKHQIICVQHKDIEALTKILKQKKADLIFFNPDTKTYPVEWNEVFQQALSHTKKNAHIFFWAHADWAHEIPSLYASNDIQYKQTCLWITNQATGKSKTPFHQTYQPCVYGTKGSPNVNKKGYSIVNILNQEVHSGSRCPEDVFDLFDIWVSDPSKRDFFASQEDKPPSIYEKPLKQCSTPGDTIVNIGHKAGGLLMACEKLKRNVYLVEPDPKTCDEILAQWEQFTSKKAIRNPKKS